MRIVLLLGLIASVQAGHSLHHTHPGSLTNVRRGSATNDDTLQTTATASGEKYKVKSGDTCSSIGKSTGATWAQLISWNSEINSQCSYVFIFGNLFKKSLV
jgi:LysM repeat protein